MAGAKPHHRYQTLLEGGLDPSAETTILSSHDRAQAHLIFDRITEYCSAHEPFNSSLPGEITRRYGRAKLVRLVYEYATPEAGRDNVLRYFLTSLVSAREDFAEVLDILSKFDDWDTPKKESLTMGIRDFADHLVDGFFIPFRASSKKTPQPTPVFSLNSNDVPVGTNQRLSKLRGSCLVRDRHRCVVSRLFDIKEGSERILLSGENAKDDEGQLFKDEEGDFEDLEVAHIIPHSLMSFNGLSTQLNDAKVYTLRILDMFDPGVIHLLDGPNIDRAYNALTLTLSLHRRFGELLIYLEPTPYSAVPHTYTVQKASQPRFPFHRMLPVTRTLFTTPDRNIDPPSSRLLAIHRACALILHHSGAAEFVNKVIRDLEEGIVKSGGTTELGTLINLAFLGWDSPVTV